MRVKELLEKLEGANPNARVVVNDLESDLIADGDIELVEIDEDGVPLLSITF